MNDHRTPDGAQGIGDDIDAVALAELTERARRLFSGPIDFLKSAPGLEFLPDPTVPEIAFASVARALS